MSTIVVGYDGSETAKHALERAAAIAAPTGSTVTVVSVVYVAAPAGRAGLYVDPDDVAEVRHELAEAEEILAWKGVQAETIERRGDAAEAILETAEEVGADLIVVGTRGLNVAERLVLGSVSTRIIHEAPCDVLVVR
jgi:nucleotide-binding universal stress UspA family protein